MTVEDSPSETEAPPASPHRGDVSPNAREQHAGSAPPFPPCPSDRPAVRTPRARTSESWTATCDEGRTILVCYDLSDDEACLESCSSPLERLVLPSHAQGKVIAEIGADAFLSCPNVRDLTCPPHVTYLHAHALRNCRTVEMLVLPRDLERFERSWINGCSSIRELTLPDALEKIPSKLFNAMNIKRLHVGRCAREVDDAAFHNSTLDSISVHPENTHLATDGYALFRVADATLLALAVQTSRYVVPDGCRHLGRKSFVYQEGLKRVDLPDSLESIEPYAFMNAGIQSFKAPSNLTSIGEKAFYHCADLREVTLDEKLLSIGSSAFCQTSITHLRVPAATADIGAAAFAGCGASPEDLASTSGEAAADSLVSTSGEAAADSPASTSRPFQLSISTENPFLRVDEQGGLYRRGEGGWVFKELVYPTTRSYTVAPGTVEVAPNAFSRHTCLERVTLPDGLTSVGDQAFRGCNRLVRIDVPESLVSIGNEALLESGVTSLYLPAGFKRLGSLTLITSGARRIASGSALSNITVHPDNERFYTTSGMLCERVDRACARVVLYFGSQANVSIPSEVTAIGPYAFAGARGIRHLHIHNRVSSIGLCGLSVGEAVEVVTIDLPKPVDGTSTAEVHFPNNSSGQRAMQQAFHEPSIDIAGAISFSDHAIAWIPDLYERARWALRRLENPFLLSGESRARFTSILTKNFAGVCDAFARHNYAHGFDALFELGFLNEGNVSAVIDRISASHDVAITGHLLELKHRRMRTPELDFDL